MSNPVAAASPGRGELSVIVLAAGAGTRMKSALPKPLHPVAGVPMIEHVLAAAEALDPADIVVVASNEVASRFETTGLGHRAKVVVQDPPRGTGDAVLIGLRAVEHGDAALVMYADHPLVSVNDLNKMLARFRDHQARIVLLTCVVEDAAGYGRIARNEDNAPVAIVEKVVDDPALRQGPTEINSGIQVLDVTWARDALATLPPNPIKNEVFLTDLVSVATVNSGGGTPVVTVEGSPETLLGVNDRAELAVVDTAFRQKIARRLMEAGVTIKGPETVFIDAGVVIGSDTTIHPFSILSGSTRIGSGCTIGPHTSIDNSVVGEGVVIEASVIRDSHVGDNCHVGPWSHLRNGVVLDRDVHIGNFVEAKNSHLHSGVRAGHMSYLGDATVGHHSNIGAGTITCNFDGREKHRTSIGANVFIGSDSMLVAPLSIGDGAATGAGSVVTKDVEAGAKVVGVPARPIRRRGGST